MIALPRLEGPSVGGPANAGAPGWYYDEHVPALRFVTVRCACGKLQTLDLRLDRHSVDAEGRVSPSLRCAFDCGWHVWARLEGWTFGAM